VSICNGFIVYIENLSELTRKKLQLWQHEFSQLMKYKAHMQKE
jgi:hypothetical protein